MVLKIKHNCKEHPFQDSRYGKDKRVFTVLKDNKGYRCTVCGSTQT